MEGEFICSWLPLHKGAENKMALYEDLKRVDMIIAPIHELLNDMTLIIKDGKIVYSLESEHKPFEPWLYTRTCPDRARGS